MRFRTEIELRPSEWKIDHNAPVVMLGSCFTDEIGERMEHDGFEVVHNPFGPLYNPLSLANCIGRAAQAKVYTAADLTVGPRGFHCLDYAMRFSGPDATVLLEEINNVQTLLGSAIERASVAVLTLGSAFVFDIAATGKVAGNCHKFPADAFRRRLLGVDESAAALSRCVESLVSAGVGHVLFTVSPIRHLADGLHGNTVSKATLHLAVEEVCALHEGRCAYFPSYEILVDDLRDYRFYASDMKHPSVTAVDYIYEKFATAYFSPATQRRCADARRAFLAANHRPVL